MFEAKLVTSATFNNRSKTLSGTEGTGVEEMSRGDAGGGTGGVACEVEGVAVEGQGTNKTGA